MAKETTKNPASSLDEEFEKLSDCEVLANLIRRVVVRRKAEEVAEDLMAEFGSFARVIDATPKELKKIKGMGDAACSVITLLPLFYRKYRTGNVRKGTSFADREKLANFICDCMIGHRNEVLLVVCLNAKSKLISWKIIHEGSIHSVDISIRKILDYALTAEAEHLVIAHNHVDGTLYPSQEDFETTAIIFEALEPLKIILDDHIITSGNEYLSLKKFGAAREEKNDAGEDVPLR